MEKSLETLVAKRLIALDDIASAPAAELGCRCWNDFQGGPRTLCRFGRYDDKLVIGFTVCEAGPRAEMTVDHQPVCQDSCVEFFCQMPGDERYCNFEFNSRGVCLAKRRKLDRTDARPFSPEEMAQILRVPSVCADQWRLTVAIPFALIGCDDVPKKLLFNCYKCGDRTAEPHYISLFPIDAPKPSFHRPDAFGELEVQ